MTLGVLEAGPGLEGGPPSWEEVDALFAEALDLPRAERPAFVAGRARGRPDLIRTLESLLEVGEEADRYLTRARSRALRRVWCSPGAGHEAPPPETPEAPGLEPGAWIGPYRIVERVARGGMGTVYRAERLDGQFRRTVALKVLRRGLDTDDVLRRFLAERQILASLDHPNIARLHDGGAADDGRPYLAMEFVEGEPVTAYCDRHHLTVEERVRLLCTVARAVQHAHGHLVVHRDLKPSNILVTPGGVVKLVDFGIAKLLEASDAGDPGLRTRTGVMVLTPGYASPEQLRGGPVTTATDVYALGLLLYEVLSGRRAPVPGDGSSAEGTILSGRDRPRRPSAAAAEPPDATDDGTGATPEALARARRTTVDVLRRRLSGDLDRIVLMALRPEPSRRYPTAEELARDLERYLDGQPVTAHEDSLGYRARKFVGRHRSGVAAAAAFVLLLGTSTAVATSQARERARERDRAERVTDFLTQLFLLAEPNRAGGELVTARDLLDEGAGRVEAELAGHPQAQAELFSTFGRVYQDLGLTDEARPLLAQAVELRRGTARDKPEGMVHDLRRLAAVTERQDPDASIALLEEAVARAERELGHGDPALASALIDLGEHRERRAYARGQPELQEAQAHFERALSILRAQRGDVRAELARALSASRSGLPPEEVRERLREVLELRRDLYVEDHTAVAGSLNDLALALERVDPEAADSLLARAVEINRRIHGEDHHQTLTLMNNRAGFLRDRGLHAAAEPIYREVLERRLAAYPNNTVGHAYSMHGLGWVLAEMERATEAETYLREVVRILEEAGHGQGSVVYQIALNTLGRALAMQGRHADAEPLLVGSYERLLEAGRDPADLYVLRDRVVQLYEAWGRPHEAAAYRRPAESGPEGGFHPPSAPAAPPTRVR